MADDREQDPTQPASPLPDLQKWQRDLQSAFLQMAKVAMPSLDEDGTVGVSVSGGFGGTANSQDKLADAMLALADAIRTFTQDHGNAKADADAKAQIADQAAPQDGFDVLDDKGRISLDKLRNLSEEDAQAIKDDPEMWGQLGRNARQAVGDIASGNKRRREQAELEKDTARWKKELEREDAEMRQWEHDEGDSSSGGSSVTDVDSTLDFVARTKPSREWEMSQDEYRTLLSETGIGTQDYLHNEKHETDFYPDILQSARDFGEEQRKFRRELLLIIRRLISDNANDNIELQELQRMLEQSRTAL